MEMLHAGHLAVIWTSSQALEGSQGRKDLFILRGLHEITPDVIKVAAHSVIIVQAACNKHAVAQRIDVSGFKAAGLPLPVAIPILIGQCLSFAAPPADNVQRLTLCCCKVCVF